MNGKTPFAGAVKRIVDELARSRHSSRNATDWFQASDRVVPVTEQDLRGRPGPRVMRGAPPGAAFRLIASSLSMSDQNELGINDEGLPGTTLERIAMVMKLLSETTSISVVSEYLKSKGLHHSAGSWAELNDKRILPAVHMRKLTFDDLSRLLSECEEYGRTNTFLYSVPKVDVPRLMEKATLERVCKRLGCSEALDGIEVQNMPEKPTLTQIRHEDRDTHKCVVFKIVEKRRERLFLGESEEGDVVTKRWRNRDVRAVNVGCLHASGLLEIRIRSHLSSRQYSKDLNRIWQLLKDFLPPTLFKPYSLDKAKSRLWENKKSLKKMLRYSDTTLRNRKGNTIIASTGTESATLFDDDGTTGSLDHFLEHGGAYCDSSNIWWRPVDGILSREIHMLLSGLNNEFAITAECSKGEYEYVLNELRNHSR